MITFTGQKYDRMLRFIIYIGVIGILLSCTTSAPALQSGDLLFQVTRNSPMTEAIRTATGRKGSIKFSHVAIFVSCSPVDSVIEASSEGGVKMTALHDFLRHSAEIDGKPCVVAKRLRDTAGRAAAVTRAKKHIGLPYDYSFRPENGKYYCSELVHDTYLSPDGRPRFTAKPMNFRAEDGSMPRYWTELYERLGEPIPEGEPGTNPDDMAAEELLYEVYRWF